MLNLARIERLRRRFFLSTRGVAAIEFAMIAPVLAILFLASFDGGRAIAIYMKVRSATYTLDSIANQYTTIAATDMSDIVGATSVVLAPYSSSPIKVTVTQIAISNKSKATVAWSYSLNGTAHTKGAAIAIPAALKTKSSYLMFGEVSYTFTPLFGYFTAGTITFSDNLYVTPRNSSCIKYTPITGTSCT